ncbi:hypothetical protein NHX12_027914, partial [Muraenolepis orangiensis]
VISSLSRISHHSIAQIKGISQSSASGSRVERRTTGQPTHLQSEPEYRGLRVEQPPPWLDTALNEDDVYRSLEELAEPLVHRPLVYRPLVYRPLVYGPLVYRPLVYRPLVYRLLVYRPLVYRPLVHRPLVYQRPWGTRSLYGPAPDLPEGTRLGCMLMTFAVVEAERKLSVVDIAAGLDEGLQGVSEHDLGEDDIYDCVPCEDDGDDIYEDIIKVEVRQPMIRYMQKMGMTEDDKRNCCLVEIQETEAKYYKTLEDIEKNYMIPLKLVFSVHEMEAIFVNLEEVIKVHLALLRAIDLSMLGGGSGLGHIFLDFKERSQPPWVTEELDGISVRPIIGLKHKDVRVGKQLTGHQSTNHMIRVNLLKVVVPKVTSEQLKELSAE